tara:strand:- start:272 stop:466 length:195 start_codon:yes stop_codon:yes gene_type:complete
MSLDLPLNYATEKLPPVNGELIVWLREVYKDQMPSDTDMMEIRYKQGQLSVVKTLISIHEELKN